MRVYATSTRSREVMIAPAVVCLQCICFETFRERFRIISKLIYSDCTIKYQRFNIIFILTKYLCPSSFLLVLNILVISKHLTVQFKYSIIFMLYKRPVLISLKQTQIILKYIKNRVVQICTCV